MHFVHNSFFLGGGRVYLYILGKLLGALLHLLDSKHLNRKKNMKTNFEAPDAFPTMPRLQKALYHVVFLVCLLV